ncbi:MAG: PqqD family protein [Candidatus Rokubacteria bacterium]|nr:PqqD family protein [Candidatus Rokubacteria bacterium]
MQRPTLAAVVQISPDVVFRELDGGMVILNLAGGTYYGLDEVGTRAWTLIRDGGALGPVFEALQSEYDVAPSVLERDLLDLVGRLCEKGLASVSLDST